MLTVLLVLGVLVVLFIAATVATGEGPILVDAPADVADVELPAGQLQPEDVHGLRFGLAIRGYRMSEVDLVLDRMAAELAERDRRIVTLEHKGGPASVSVPLMKPVEPVEPVEPVLVEPPVEPPLDEPPPPEPAAEPVVPESVVPELRPSAEDAAIEDAVLQPPAPPVEVAEVPVELAPLPEMGPPTTIETAEGVTERPHQPADTNAVGEVRTVAPTPAEDVATTVDPAAAEAARDEDAAAAPTGVQAAPPQD